MSMRCKSCDKILSNKEISYNYEQKKWEDLCYKCIEASRDLSTSEFYDIGIGILIHPDDIESV